MAKPSLFTWYELMTPDPQAAADLYREVVGWTAEPAENAPIPYWLLSADGVPAAGLMGMSAADGMVRKQPGWLASVEVEDVDAACDRVRELGGSVHIEPMDIPAVARFAVVADPEGAVFGLMRWTADQPPHPPLMAVGHAGWHELAATDAASVLPFYEGLFGWRELSAMEMGSIGAYHIVGLEAEKGFAGIWTRPKEMPEPYWLTYFSVASIDAAKAKVEERGGQIIAGPMEVPGGMWIIQFIDPQGALSALVGPR